MLNWTFSFDIITTEDPHQAIYAFMRTSHWGQWRLQPTAEDDQFVLHFERGNSQAPTELLPLQKPSQFTSLTPRGVPESDIFVKLRIAIRPFPKRSLLTICYSIPPLDPTSDPDKALPWILDAFERETKALAAYLDEVFDLPERPPVHYHPLP